MYERVDQTRPSQARLWRGWPGCKSQDLPALTALTCSRAEVSMRVEEWSVLAGSPLCCRQIPCRRRTVPSCCRRRQDRVCSAVAISFMFHVKQRDEHLRSTFFAVTSSALHLHVFHV